MRTPAKPHRFEIERRHPLAQGLVYSLPVLERNSVTGPKDLGPSRKHAVITGSSGSWSNQKYGPTYHSVRAGGGYLESAISASTICPKAFTLSLRFRFTAIVGVSAWSWTTAGNSGNPDPWTFLRASGSDLVWYFDGNYRVTATGRNAAGMANIFQHFIVVCDGTTWRVYADGALVGTYTGTYATNLANATAIFTGNGFSDGVTADFDHVHVWKRALSRHEIGQVFSDPLVMCRRLPYAIGISVLSKPKPSLLPDKIFGKDILFTDDLDLGPDGDYIVLSGKENLRQGIRRRLMVKPGEYKLRPNYGVGIGTFVKKTMSQSHLDQLKQRIIDNISLDPRVEKVLKVELEKQTFSNGRTGLKVFVSIRALGRDMRLEPLTFSEIQGEG